MYEVLTGQLPFSDPSPDELARLHREEMPVSPRQLNPEITSALEQVILKVLSKEPSARYRTADQLGRVLLTLMDSDSATPSSIEDSPPPPPSAPTAGDVSEKPETISGPIVISDQDFFDIDWVAIGLGLIALIAVGGLIPFWLWVYFVYNPPVR